MRGGARDSIFGFYSFNIISEPLLIHLTLGISPAKFQTREGVDFLTLKGSLLIELRLNKCLLPAIQLLK